MSGTSGFRDIEVPTATVDSLRNGDRAALAAAYAELARPVYTLARRILDDSGLAEEVTQETFVDVMTKISMLADVRSFTTWVRSIAVNRCLMALRSPWSGRREAFDEQTADETARGDRSERTDGLLDIERALALLTADARTVLWLHDVEGYTHREIGKLFGRSASFSKSQLARTYHKLKQLKLGASAPSTDNGSEDATTAQPHTSF